MLSDKAVKEYQDSEARIEAENFISLFRLIYRPIQKKAIKKDDSS